MSKRIYISGASGAGVSTLGTALAAKLQIAYFDVDDYYWYLTDPPFEQSRPPAERLELLNRNLPDDHWVLSGSMDGWGNEVIQRADLVVFIETPTALRIERLKARESQRFGERILPGGDMHANHLAFIEWANSYEDGTQAGRSRPRHEHWLQQLTLPFIKVNGELSTERLLTEVIAVLQD